MEVILWPSVLVTYLLIALFIIGIYLVRLFMNPSNIVGYSSGGIKKSKTNLYFSALTVMIATCSYCYYGYIVAKRQHYIRIISDKFSEMDLNLKIIESSIDSARISLIYYTLVIILPMVFSTESGSARLEETMSKCLVTYFSIVRLPVYPAIIHLFYTKSVFALFLIHTLCVSELLLLLLIYIISAHRIEKFLKILSGLRLFDRYDIEATMKLTKIQIYNMAAYIFLELIYHIIQIFIIFINDRKFIRIFRKIIFLLKPLTFLYQFQAIGKILFLSTKNVSSIINRVENVKDYLKKGPEPLIIRQPSLSNQSFCF